MATTTVQMTTSDGFTIDFTVTDPMTGQEQCDIKNYVTEVRKLLGSGEHATDFWTLYGTHTDNPADLENTRLGIRTLVNYDTSRYPQVPTTVPTG